MSKIEDIDPYINFESEITKLKHKLDAVILSHYYQDEEIQNIADFIGDSFELAKKALHTKAKTIVFCGVKFMAEVAHIFNPDKKVLIPDMEAGCSLEYSCRPTDFSHFREQHPNHVALTYINCSAEIKALSDIIVTSSNAERIINNIPKDKPILFAPDKHLGRYLINKTGREMTLWNGTCIVHDNFSQRELIKLKASHPKAHIIAHPECPDHLLAYAHHIGSTSSLLHYTTKNNGHAFIILTESGIIHQMRKNSPNSIFHAVPINQQGCSSCSTCPYMRLNNIEKLYLCMLNQFPVVTVNKDVSLKARIALDQMIYMAT